MIDLNRIYPGDCTQVMKTWPDAFVDAVITDPPFGIGFNYSGTKEACSSPAQYWKWFKQIWPEVLRITKPGGLIAIWQTQLYAPHFQKWFGKDIHVFVMAKNFIQMRPCPIQFSYDPVVMLYKPGAAPLAPEKPRNSKDFYVANTAGVISDVNRLEKGHPCPRPLDALLHLISNFTLPGGLVADPFAGSGTTLLAAEIQRRPWVGIEINSAYVEIANARIANETAQLKMAI